MFLYAMGLLYTSSQRFWASHRAIEVYPLFFLTDINESVTLPLASIPRSVSHTNYIKFFVDLLINCIIIQLEL